MVSLCGASVLDEVVNDVLTSNLKAVKSHDDPRQGPGPLDGDGVSSLRTGNVERGKPNSRSVRLILRDLYVSLSDCVNNLLNLEGDL